MKSRVAHDSAGVTPGPHYKAFHYVALLLDELDIRTSRPNEALRFALIEWIKAGQDEMSRAPNWLMRDGSRATRTRPIRHKPPLSV